MPVRDAAAGGSGHGPAHLSGRRRARHRGRWLLVAGVVVLAALGMAWWLLSDARTARAELFEAAALVSELQADVLAGDDASVDSAVAALQAHAEAALDATDGPHWAIAARVPWVGPNVEAVRTVAVVMDDLAHDAVPTLLEATDVVDPSALAPVDGRIALDPLVEAAPRVVAADEAVQAAVARMDAVDAEALWPFVADAFEEARQEVDEVSVTTATASRAVRLLPPMLGRDGPRTYLVLVQNNAELRATGGIPGSILLLRADNGGVEILDHRSGGSLGDLPAPVTELTDAEMALFGEDLAADMRDVTFTPDFPRGASIARQIWAQEVGGEVDGVVSVDPGTLALVLGATGPVPMPPGAVADVTGGQLTADNAVEVLLSTVYLTLLDPREQDEFFAQTAAGVFGALVGGAGEPSATIEALAQAARQGRLLVWSAREGEQALLADTVLSGALRGEAGDSPVIGVFLNDGSQAKMSYYLDVSTEVGGQTCAPDGSRLVELDVTLTNTVDPALVGTLPTYVTGSGTVVPIGEVRTNVLVYAPTGGQIEDVTIMNDVPGVSSQVQNGLPVVGKTVQLKPGQSVSVVATISVDRVHRGPVVLRTSPGRVVQDVPLVGVQCS
ncbi:DUF4012 domain-containing protein [Actinotalea fermentans]|uniref:DUF4012 domain-containing protein n=1 Tax=Actinotalea fermentans TaxID=43671 RepID=A0A511Z1I5_9CELL|nr:DUF4012 domain-containing protein [Actinotalea fermentans]KGM17071.1 hypothetical protein N867_10590 [Actinotalea fermentans ATCC 43279 = JCM 9966 = DSM 3133]GEN81294.1 hypothetical protein AFE02nite_30280 [Actinotalea fermentans]